MGRPAFDNVLRGVVCRSGYEDILSEQHSSQPLGPVCNFHESWTLFDCQVRFIMLSESCWKDSIIKHANYEDTMGNTDRENFT